MGRRGEEVKKEKLMTSARWGSVLQPITGSEGVWLDKTCIGALWPGCTLCVKKHPGSVFYDNFDKR